MNVFLGYERLVQSSVHKIRENQTQGPLSFVLRAHRDSVSGTQVHHLMNSEPASVLGVLLNHAARKTVTVHVTLAVQKCH